MYVKTIYHMNDILFQKFIFAINHNLINTVECLIPHLTLTPTMIELSLLSASGNYDIFSTLSFRVSEVPDQIAREVGYNGNIRIINLVLKKHPYLAISMLEESVFGKQINSIKHILTFADPNATTLFNALIGPDIQVFTLILNSPKITSQQIATVIIDGLAADGFITDCKDYDSRLHLLLSDPRLDISDLFPFLRQPCNKHEAKALYDIPKFRQRLTKEQELELEQIVG